MGVKKPPELIFFYFPFLLLLSLDVWPWPSLSTFVSIRVFILLFFLAFSASPTFCEQGWGDRGIGKNIMIERESKNILPRKV